MDSKSTATVFVRYVCDLATKIDHMSANYTKLYVR